MGSEDLESLHQGDIGPVPLVQVEGLRVSIPDRDGKPIQIIRGMDFDLQSGEALCLLGESGSGKSVTMRSLLRLLPPHASLSGNIKVDGQDVLAVGQEQLRRMRGDTVAMIFQEPATALDPAFTIGTQIVEAIRAHDDTIDYAKARAAALDLLEIVQIPSARRRLDAYPAELSGGLRQRAMIALALCCRPKLLLADEPTTALDATVQIQILLLLRELQKKFGMGIIIVTHDIAVACEIADRVAVIYAGQIVEMAPVSDIMVRPQHPYTRGLLSSVVTENSTGSRLEPIPGSPPDLESLPRGCSFAPRCASVSSKCMEIEPNIQWVTSQHAHRCINLTQQPEDISS